MKAWLELRASMIGILLTLAATLIGQRTQSVSAQPRPAGDFVITNARVFDGNGMLPRAGVVVRGGTIRAVGFDVSGADGIPRVDAEGATLLPGFIDAHVHVRDAEDLRQALRFGATTVLDMGALVDPRALFALRKAAAAVSDMADLRLAGFYANAPPGDAPPDPRSSVEIPPVASVEAAREFVAVRRAEGADYIKIVIHGARTAQTGVPSLDAPRVKALIEAAHLNGLLAVAHVETLNDVRIAIDAGIDGLMHVWREGGPAPEVAQRLAARPAFVVPTLSVPDALVDDDGRAALLKEPAFKWLITPTIVKQLGASFAPQGGTAAIRSSFESEIAAVRGLRHADVVLLAGSDAAQGNPTALGISFHRELELLVRAGLRPIEALSAATMNTAKAFRLSDRGRIAPGLRADMLLVRGDPSQDILATRDILRIWKAGVEVDRNLHR
jgi:imidazolonepropionase-like amidohydrolase